MKRLWKEDLESFAGLEYIKIKQVPMRYSTKGGVIDVKPLVIEKLVARALIASRVPLHGAEVKLLRASLGLSLDKFARRLGLTPGAIFYWEKAAQERLSVVNEIAVRALFADELAVEISGRLSQLVGSKAEDLIINMGRGARRS